MPYRPEKAAVNQQPRTALVEEYARVAHALSAPARLMIPEQPAQGEHGVEGWPRRLAVSPPRSALALRRGAYVEVEAGADPGIVHLSAKPERTASGCARLAHVRGAPPAAMDNPVGAAYRSGMFGPLAAALPVLLAR